MCQGAITIDGDKVTRNLAYYTIGHASKFIPDGSVRISSTLPEGLSDVAFETPEGKTVVIVANKSGSVKDFNIVYKDQILKYKLNTGSVATFVW